MSQQTKSEKIFEEFCKTNNITCDKILESIVKRPDYRLNLSGQELIVEIKQFDPNEEEKIMLKAEEKEAFSIDPGDRIRKAIRKANRQLKRVSLGQIPTLLVVFDNVTPGSDPLIGHTCSYSMMTAIKGVDEIPVEIFDDPGRLPLFGEVRSGGKRTMRENMNTTISAVAAMYQDLKTSLFIYHNPFAAIPLSTEILRFDGVFQYKLPMLAQNSYENDWIQI